MQFQNNGRIQEEFGDSRRLVKNARTLLQKKGPYSRPEIKIVRNTPQDVIDMIKEFYYSDDISRVMPEMNDT